ncbi:TPA: hypothetical protein P1K45_002193 [Klebsiella pneumoniae]|nr:hypothetical protein [Klebsiella pneumoniae]HDN2555253.1 hypothetical protein [Klebsiella pneumoniae]
MTTDITELAQREKFEVWAEEAGALPWGILKKHRNKDGNYPGPHYTYMWKAWQAASAELVEALEKAQRYIEELREWNAGLAQESFERQQRISELLEGKVGNALLERENHHVEVVGKLLDCISELESRAVKLPDALLPATHKSGELFMTPDNVEQGGYLNRDDVLRVLRAAGIKVEAE